MPKKAVRKSSLKSKKKHASTSWRKKPHLRVENVISSKKTKRYITVSILFFVSVSLFFGFITFKKVSEPFASALSDQTNYLLEKNTFASLVIFVDDIDAQNSQVTSANVMIFNNSTQITYIYNIPIDFELDVPGKFSYEPVANILSIGKSISKNENEEYELLVSTLQKQFAFPIDRYLVVDSSIQQDIQGFLFEGNRDVKFDITLLKSLSSNISTNISGKELYYIYTFLSQLPKDKFIQKQLTEANILDKSILDEELRDLTIDSNIAKEKLTIVVLNGSDKVGAANYTARVIENMGGRVVKVSNTQDEYQNSLIVTNDNTTLTFREIAKYFNVKNVVSKDKSDIDDPELLRADIIVILGVDTTSVL